MNIMKAKSTIKKVIVKSLDWEKEVSVDNDIFDDVYLEAATEIIDKNKNNPKFRMSVVFECFLKKDKNKLEKHYIYNSYYLLVNCGLHEKAEMLRQGFIKEHGIDLKKESLRG